MNCGLPAVAAPAAKAGLWTAPRFCAISAPLPPHFLPRAFYNSLSINRFHLGPSRHGAILPHITAYTNGAPLSRTSSISWLRHSGAPCPKPWPSLPSPFCFLLSAFSFLLSAFCFLLSAFCLLPSPSGRLSSIVTPLDSSTPKTGLCALPAPGAWRKWLSKTKR